MKKTNQEILDFLQGAQVWLRQNTEDSKFRYAVNRVVKRAESIRTHLQNEIEDINLANALEDGTPKKLLRNDRGEFEYTKEGMLARNKAIRKLMTEESEIEPYIATEVPDLKNEHKDLFEGFVLQQGQNGSDASNTIT